MNMPGFTAEASIYVETHYYSTISIGALKNVAVQPQLVPRAGAVMPQQGLLARPPIDIPPISVNCDQRRRSCGWGCDLFYRICVHSGVPERTCADRGLVCHDGCALDWERCRGLLRDPNFDPFADRFAGPG
jgi:hypothetical protein